MVAKIAEIALKIALSIGARLGDSLLDAVVRVIVVAIIATGLFVFLTETEIASWISDLFGTEQP